MNHVTMVKTCDGTLHNTELAARHHAERRYTEASYSLAGELFNLIHSSAKLCEIAGYIDANLSRFAALIPLKDDISVTEENR